MTHPCALDATMFINRECARTLTDGIGDSCEQPHTRYRCTASGIVTHFDLAEDKTSENPATSSGASVRNRKTTRRTSVTHGTQRILAKSPLERRFARLRSMRANATLHWDSRIAFGRIWYHSGYFDEALSVRYLPRYIQ